MNKKLFGLIYMSSYKIQMNIVNLKKMTIVEKLDSPTFIQSDTNSKFELYEQSLDKICEALEGFKRKLEEYKITNSKFYANRQLLSINSARFIQDQIEVRTGFRLEWLNSSQVVYNKLLAGNDGFSNDQVNKLVKYPTYLLSLGSAMMNLSLFKEGHFMWTWPFALGPQELQDLEEVAGATTGNPSDVMADYIGADLRYLGEQIEQTDNATMIIQHAVALTHKFMSDEETPVYITVEQFDDFFNEIIDSPVEYWAQRYQLDQSDLVHVIPNLILIKQVIDYLKPQNIYLTEHSVISGLIIQEKNEPKVNRERFNNIIMTSVQNMAQRYNVDLKHATAVREFALHIFDQMKRLKLVKEEDRKLLEIAATLAEVGNFISRNTSNKDSAYIIENNKIIGLSDRENEMVAEITSYGINKNTIKDLSYFNPEMQVDVAKIAGILKIARALDASHKQKINKIAVSIKNENVTIKAVTADDITFERWRFKKNAELFKKVFGMDAILKQKRGR